MADRELQESGSGAGSSSGGSAEKRQQNPGQDDA